LIYIFNEEIINQVIGTMNKRLNAFSAMATKAYAVKNEVGAEEEMVLVLNR